MLLRLPGRANCGTTLCEMLLARLQGRVVSPDCGGPPNDKRLCRRLILTALSSAVREGVTKSVVVPLLRFLLLRIVTVAGTPWARIAGGDERGGVLVGPGNFDRADCTLSSNFCILPISPRIWYNDPERGTLSCRSTFDFGGRRAKDGVVIPLLVSTEGSLT